MEGLANTNICVHHPFLKEILKLPSTVYSEICCFSPSIQ